MMQPHVLFVHCPLAIFLFELSYFITFDGQEHRICFMNRADLSSCQSPTVTVSWLIDLDARSLESDIASSMTQSPFSLFFSSLSFFFFFLNHLFNPPAISSLRSVLNNLEHKSPVDFSLNQGCRQSISGNSMKTTDECLCSSISNSGLFAVVQS